MNSIINSIATINNTATMNTKETTMSTTEIATFRAEMMFDIVDDARYADQFERTLAMHGDDAVTLYPSAEELVQRGFDIDTLGVMLMHRCINGEGIAHLVNAADTDDSVANVNRQLAARRPFINVKGDVITVESASELGIDLNLLTACRGRSLPDDALFELLSNVQRGKTLADDANTGLAHYADGDVIFA